MLDRPPKSTAEHPLATWLARLDVLGEAPLTEQEGRDLRAVLADEMEFSRGREHAAEMVAFLGAASELLSGSLELRPTMRNVMRLALPRFADWVNVDLVGDDGALRTYAVQHVNPEMQRFAIDMENRAHFDYNAPGGVGKVWRTGEIDLFEVIEPWVIDEGVPDPKDRAMYRAWGAHSAIVVPMRSRGRIIGVITFVYGDPARQYSADDIPFVQDFANRAALSVDNARMFEHEHRVADTLQNATLPERLPRIPGFVFDEKYFPGRVQSNSVIRGAGCL